MLLFPIFQLVRDRYYWSPPRLGRIIWGVSTNFETQLEVLKLLACPQLKGIVLADPQLAFRFLTRDYLARGLTVAERAACFTHHYNYLQRRFPARILHLALNRGLPLLEITEDGVRYSVTMGLAKQEVREGEFYLQLSVDGLRIYVLQFTIVPGSVVGSRAADVLLISRLQGVKGCYPQIYSATKAFRDVAPPALLMAVLQGFAQAFHIDEMAGVHAARQFAYLRECADSFYEAYDQFFTELGATRSSAGFFSSPLPIDDKPLDGIRNGHKSRTRKKRAFKLRIAERVCLAIREGAEEP